MNKEDKESTGILVVAISSSALFDLTEGQKVFEEHGIRYRVKRVRKIGDKVGISANRGDQLAQHTMTNIHTPILHHTEEHQLEL